MFLSRLLVLCSAAFCVSANIEFKRHIDAVSHGNFSLTFDSGCTGKDMFGDVQCKFNWGQKVSGAVSGSLDEDLDAGSNVDVSLKLDRFIPFKLKCPLCGSTCGFKIPIIGKEVSFKLPPCPIKAGSINKQNFIIPLPSKAPIEAKVVVTGTITINDSHNAKVLQFDFSADMSP